MTPLFHPHLLNGPFGDPVVYVDCLFERRGLMFDLGEVPALPPRRILKLTDVFISHTHMDHFMGFDHLLRVSLGRGRTLRLYGPPGLVDQVGHKLAAYTWNLVESYETDFTIVAHEADLDARRMRAARYRTRTRFAREDLGERPMMDGILLEEETFQVRAAALDHRIPSFAFALEETLHMNIWKNRLQELGLPTGPWLSELKAAVRRGDPDDQPFAVRWHDSRGHHERVFPLAQLRDEVIRIVPGQKIAYVVDSAYHAQNARRVVDIARDADWLFIETVFLQEDADRAADKYHLTTLQAAELARAAGAKRFVPMHFSARYLDEEDRVRAEAETAFAGGERPPTYI